MQQEDSTPIQNFYKDKAVFITGVTGVVGKVLLEKLLRCCPDISHIYVMIREKRGKSVEERLDDLFNLELFDLIKKECPSFRKKVSAINGDLEAFELGINELDLEKLKTNVNIIFHNAARVRWDDELKKHVQCQVVATKFLLNMAKSFEKIEAFVYVSTAAVFTGIDHTITESIPKTHISPSQITEAMKWMNDDSINVLVKSLKKKGTICYALTKAITEKAIEEEHDDIPTAIIRPSYITATYKEPFTGWCDSLQSFQGVAYAIAKGVLRTLYIPVEGTKLLCLPVDLFVNSMIATAWFIKADDRIHAEKFFLVNSGLSTEKLPDFNKETFKKLMKVVFKYPLVNIFRHPDLTVYTGSSEYQYKIHMFFDHFIPSIIVDSLLYISGQKTFMIALHKRIQHMINIMLKLWSPSLIFKMENNQLIQNSLSEKDAEIFFMDLKDFDYFDYMDKSVIKGRALVAKEDDSTLEYAVQKAKTWKFVTTALKWLIILYIVNLLFTIFT